MFIMKTRNSIEMYLIPFFLLWNTRLRIKTFTSQSETLLQDWGTLWYNVLITVRLVWDLMYQTEESGWFWTDNETFDESFDFRNV